jgi:predicted PurR-regulated permease PerM
MTKAPSSASSGIRSTGILVAVVAILYIARDLLIPLAFAITLTLILTPAVSLLQKIHVGRVPAVVLVMLVSMMAAGAIGWVILGQLIEVVNEFPRYQENIHHKIQSLRPPSKGALGRAAQSVQDLGKELSSTPEPAAPPASNERRRSAPNPPSGPLPVQIVETPPGELQYLRDVASPFLAPLAVFGIVLIFTVFLLIEQRDLRNRLFRLVGLDQLNVMTQALNDATQRVSRYLLLLLTVNTGFGLVCGCGLYFIGVPYAALWGTFAAILRIVPYVGSAVALLLPLVLSLAVFDHWMPPLLVFLLFASSELVTGNFIEPWLYGIHTGISSLALLLSTVFWAMLWGPAGLILSTPLTVCAVVLGRYVPQFWFLHILLGDEPVLAADARIYQRLLAMDDQEARTVAALYLKGNSLTQLYDAVMIPALTMAEQDRHKGALDPSREEFLFLSVKEMLAEFSDLTLKSATEIPDGATNGQPPERPPVLPSVGRVLCLPANDEADEIAAGMLAQLLELAGCAAISFPVDSSLQQSVGLLGPCAGDIFCISALPPFAFAEARVLSQQLRARFPQTAILVGVWGFAGDIGRALQRFQQPHPDKLVGSLADAVQFVVEFNPAAVKT